MGLKSPRPEWEWIRLRGGLWLGVAGRSPEAIELFVNRFLRSVALSDERLEALYPLVCRSLRRNDQNRFLERDHGDRAPASAELSFAATASDVEQKEERSRTLGELHEKQQ
jgi:hypothetical protein